jgi:hypothetical protein
MPYPIVNTRSRTPLDPTAGARQIQGAADMLAGHFEGRRQEEVQSQRLAADREHQAAIEKLRSSLAERRDVSAFDRNRPFMETPEERHRRQLDSMQFGSGLRMNESVFNFDLEQPRWEQEHALRRTLGLGGLEVQRGQLGVAQGTLGLNRDRFNADQERLQSLGGMVGGDGEVNAMGIPHQLLSTLVTRGQIDIEDLLDPQSPRRAGLEELNRFFLTGQMNPQGRQDLFGEEEERGPGPIARLFGRARESIRRTGGDDFDAGPGAGGGSPVGTVPPAPGQGGSGAGAALSPGSSGPGLLGTGGATPRPAAESRVRGQPTAVNPEAIQAASTQEIVELINSPNFPPSALEPFLAQIQQVDPQKYAEIVAALER